MSTEGSPYYDASVAELLLRSSGQPANPSTGAPRGGRGRGGRGRGHGNNTPAAGSEEAPTEPQGDSRDNLLARIQELREGSGAS